MPEFTINLTPNASGTPKASAWYLASPDCDDWLREIVAWNVPHARLKFIPVPISRSDRMVAGVLIISESSDVNPSASCIPYAQIGPRLFAPLDAQLEPQLDEAELGQLLSDEYVYVWHPGIGLIAADRKDVLDVADLIAPLERRERRWNRAVPGVAIGERLITLAPIVEMSFEQMLEDARGDIGSEGGALETLPEIPREPGNNVLDQAARAIAFGAAGMLYGLLKMFPTGALQATWVDKLRDMAAGAMQRISAAQEHLRNKEINRLLHMLEHDPDKGLKFALPFGGGAHRGVAPPSNRLLERNIDFNLGRMGRGRPADYWNLDFETQQKLRARYRELANREMQLGRQRRAAYIFAELLNDLESAAMALSNGHHYREAALIYRDRLHRPLDAAKCLENGGLLSEAIEQYEELKMHEKVGDLHAKLGNADSAGDAYRKAAGRARADSDFLTAARLWDDKLADPAQAAKELRAGWPNSVQAIECVRQLFELFGREGEHAAAHRQVNEIACECPKSKQYVRSAQVLSEVAAGKYPDVGVREAAVTATQQVVAGRLRSAYRAEALLLVDSLSKLAPQDRLLDRDCRRFVSSLPVARAMPAASRGGLRKARTIKLGLSGVWRSAAVVGDVIVAAGVHEHRVILGRCNLLDLRDGFRIPWPDVPARTDATIVLAAEPSSARMLGIYMIGDAPLPMTAALPRTDDFPVRILAGAFPGTERTVGVTRGPRGTCFSIEDRDSAVVQITNEQGDFVRTASFSLDPNVDWGEVQIPLAMHARRENLYVAIGRYLLLIHHSAGPNPTGLSRIEFSSNICHLAGSAEHTRARLVAGLEEGAYIVWDPSRQHKMIPFATDMAAPLVGINRGGFVIAASGQSVEVFDSKEEKLTFVGGDNELPAAPIAVLTATRTDQFAIMCENGDVIVFEV
jgi:tetratricopeptide (TPR) repeat protein